MPNPFAASIQAMRQASPALIMLSLATRMRENKIQRPAGIRLGRGCGGGLFAFPVVTAFALGFLAGAAFTRRAAGLRACFASPPLAAPLPGPWR
jgi:hypothetical protein